MRIKYILFVITSLGFFLLSFYNIYIAYTTNLYLTTNQKIYFVVFLISIPTVFLLTSIISIKYHNRVNNLLYLVSAMGLGFLLYIFIGSFFIRISGILSDTLGFYLVITTTVTALVLVIYGLINAHIFGIQKIQIPKENRLFDLWKDKKVLLVSDIHIGNINQKRFLNRIVNFINKQCADLVIVAGDLVDGTHFPVDEYLNPIKNISAELGVFYVFGNHEAYFQDKQKLHEVTNSLFTETLNDKKITINNTDIVGLNYDKGETLEGLKIRLERASFNGVNPNIVIMHDPKNNIHLQNMGADIILSGHTHGGQVWPFTEVVRFVYKKYTQGLNFETKNNHNNISITSTGIGTWGPPLRVATKPEIIVLEFID